MKRNFSSFITYCIAMCLIPSLVFSEHAKEESEGNNTQAAGEIFGVAVSLGNYYFVKRALSVFGSRWNPTPKTPQEVEDIVWENLIFSYEAFKRNIEVTSEELNEEITKTLTGEKLEFNWKDNKEQYEKWLKEKVNESPELFANQIRYLIQIQKLRQQVLDSITPEVKEEEAYQEFLNEYNTLELELAQFENSKDAEEFYRKARKNAKFWDAQVKSRQEIFRRPGFVALEFLMDMWQLPKDDLYKMLKLKPGSIYQPVRIYAGKYAPVRILKIRAADPAEFPKLKQSYYEQVKLKKKYDGLNDWIKKLKEDANIKVYLKEER